MRRLCALLALLVGAAGAARADEVWLANGRRIGGEARVAADGSVEIFSAAGSLTLPAHLVARIDRSPSLERQVAGLRAALPPRDAEALYQLGRGCADHGASTLARRLFDEVLALDPEHRGARRALGFLRYEERWVTEEEVHALRGEVLFRGAWRPAGEVDRLLAWEAALARLEAERQREAAWRAHREAELARAEAEAARAAATAFSPYAPYAPYPWGPFPPVVVVTPPVVAPPPPAPKPPPEADRRPPTRVPARHVRSGLLPGAAPSPQPRGGRPGGG